MSYYIQVVTTIDNKKTAEEIAVSVINKKFAACVQISSCSSIYRWQGKVEQSDEFICTMKSRADLYPMLERAIREVHTYDVPEIIATKITDGGSDYLDWLEQELFTSK